MPDKFSLFRMARSLIHIFKGRPNIPISLQDQPLLRVILQRRSVRSFSSQPIPDDVFAAILEAARLAPSTVNLQTWTMITFTPPEWREVFQANIPFKAARAVIVVGDTHRVRLAVNAFPESPLVEYTMAVMNASLAAMNMNIAAEALGVSSVMLSETGRSGLLDVGYLKEKLKLPEHSVPLMTIVLGYARAGISPMPPKLSLDTISFPKQYRETPQPLMQDWLEQMQDGYRAGYFPSTFDKQLAVYLSKISKAEADLQAILKIPQK